MAAIRANCEFADKSRELSSKISLMFGNDRVLCRQSRRLKFPIFSFSYNSIEFFDQTINV